MQETGESIALYAWINLILLISAINTPLYAPLSKLYIATPVLSIIRHVHLIYEIVNKNISVTWVFFSHLVLASISIQASDIPQVFFFLHSKQRVALLLKSWILTLFSWKMERIPTKGEHSKTQLLGREVLGSISSNMLVRGNIFLRFELIFFSVQ